MVIDKHSHKRQLGADSTKKVLFCTTVAVTVRGFLLPHLRWFHEQGYEIHVACDYDSKGFSDVVHAIHDMPWKRHPFSLMNLKAYGRLKHIIDTSKFELVHMHTPIASVVGRLAARAARKEGTKVFYTAHGFHFYKGAPILNWLLYYPIERWLSRVTDCLITINSEDYDLAVRKFEAGRVVKINGVGVDIARFSRIYDPAERAALRVAYGCDIDDFILLYPAELNVNKNQGYLLRGMQELRKTIPNIRLLLPGPDSLNGYYQRMAEELRVADRVIFMGWQNNIPELLAITDVAVASSLREGLPINIIEAMAAGKPVVATDNRGHRELVIDGETGFLVSANDVGDFIGRVSSLYQSNNLSVMGLHASNMVGSYSVGDVVSHLACIYTGT